MYLTRRTPTDRLRGKAGWALALLVLVGAWGAAQALPARARRPVY
jgi:hypothetical protein